MINLFLRFWIPYSLMRTFIICLQRVLESFSKEKKKDTTLNLARKYINTVILILPLDIIMWHFYLSMKINVAFAKKFAKKIISMNAQLSEVPANPDNLTPRQKKIVDKASNLLVMNAIIDQRLKSISLRMHLVADFAGKHIL